MTLYYLYSCHSLATLVHFSCNIFVIPGKSFTYRGPTANKVAQNRVGSTIYLLWRYTWDTITGGAYSKQMVPEQWLRTEEADGDLHYQNVNPRTPCSCCCPGCGIRAELVGMEFGENISYTSHIFHVTKILWVTFFVFLLYFWGPIAISLFG